MKIIYADSLFVLNLAIDYLLLSCTATVCGLSRNRLRLLAGAAIGAVYSVLVYLPRCGFLSSPVMKLVSALLMSLAAYGGEKSLLRCCLAFGAVSAAFGGFVYCITLSGGYPAFDMRTLFLSFALCYLLLSLVFRYTSHRTEKSYAEVELELNGKSTRFKAMVDTGNELLDPISGDRVMVACPHALAPLLDSTEEYIKKEPVELMCIASENPALKGRMRLIPYSAVGISGMLAAFRPESVKVNGEERKMLVAISDKVWGDGFEGIV